MKTCQFCWTIALTVIGVAVALLIIWGWQQGGLALLQLGGLC